MNRLDPRPHLLRAALLACLAPCSAFAQEESPTSEPSRSEAGQDPVGDGAEAGREEEQEIEFFRNLEYREGQVTIEGGMASIDLPSGFRFYPAQAARRIVEDYWGNLEDPSTLGLVTPPGFTYESGPGWAIIVSFEEEGFVKDEDAADLDFGEILAEMKKDSAEINERRRKSGLETVEILGWAEQPRYDATEKKLYWALEAQFSASPAPALNYDVRILGRRGYLVLRAVAEASELAQISAATQDILRRTSMNPGHRYSDFNPSLDKVAAYGIGGLIAGKVLAKAGLLKLLLKPLLIGGAILAGVFAKIFRRGKKTEA